MITYIFRYKIKLNNGEIMQKEIYSNKEEIAVEKVYELYPNWESIELVNKFIHKSS